jgi:ethanolamine ammonia-lyase large subunit
MQNAAISAFQSNYLSSKIADFYDQFASAASSDGGLTADKIAQLKAAYATLINNAGAEFDALTKVVGTPTDTTSSSGNDVSSAIKGITSDEANLIAGQFGGMRLAQLQSNVIALDQKALSAISADTVQNQLVEQRAQTLLQTEIRDYTLRTANNTDNLADIKKSLASIDKKVGSGSDSLAAAGKG